MPRQTYQLCLPLTEVAYEFNKKGSPRPIPPVVKELFEVCSSSPSGLIWKINSTNGRAKIGHPAGSKNGAKWLVFVRGHGLFYAHRVVYYLQTGQNPGSMVVRHVGSDELVLGWQDDNGRDEKGVTKSSSKKAPIATTEQPTKNKVNQVIKKRWPVVGNITKTMYLYQGVLYNAKSLCEKLGLNYSTIYQRIHRCKQSGPYAFAAEGVEVEEFSIQ